MSKRKFVSSAVIRSRIRKIDAVRERKLEGASAVYEISSNLGKESINEILLIALDFIDRIRHKFS